MEGPADDSPGDRRAVSLGIGAISVLAEFSANKPATGLMACRAAYRGPGTDTQIPGADDCILPAGAFSLEGRAGRLLQRLRGNNGIY